MYRNNLSSQKNRLCTCGQPRTPDPARPIGLGPAFDSRASSHGSASSALVFDNAIKRKIVQEMENVFANRELRHMLT